MGGSRWPDLCGTRRESPLRGSGPAAQPPGAQRCAKQCFASAPLSPCRLGDGVLACAILRRRQGPGRPSLAYPFGAVRRTHAAAGPAKTGHRLLQSWPALVEKTIRSVDLQSREVAARFRQEEQESKKKADALAERRPLENWRHPASRFVPAMAFDFPVVGDGHVAGLPASRADCRQPGRAATVGP